MARRQNRNRIIALFLCAALAAGMTCPFQAGAASLSAEELQEKIEQYESALQQQADDLDQKKAYNKTLDAQLEAMNEKIDVNQREIDALNAEISTKDEEIARLESQINQKQQELDSKAAEISAKEQEKQQTTALLKNRIRASYMSGQVSALELLLNVDSFGKFLAAFEYIERIAAHDQDLMKTYTRQVQEIEEARQQVDSVKTELDAEKTQRENSVRAAREKRAQLLAAQESQKGTAESLKVKVEENDRDASALNQQYLQNQRDLARAQAELDEIQAELDRSSEQHRQDTAQSGGQGGSGGEVSDAGFLWPLPGYTHLSTYYMQGNPPHTGIDIPAPEGTPIVATKSGRVEAWPGGRGGSWWSYGNYLVIYHDDGSSSLYAHCSSVDVPDGAYVTQGEQVASVGHTGQVYGATGNHLHFELRVNGRVDPLDYLSR